MATNPSPPRVPVASSSSQTAAPAVDLTGPASSSAPPHDLPIGLPAFTITPLEIPSNLLTFTKQDSIPCGVMVVLGMTAEIDTPKWQTEEEHDRLKNTTG